ncbi:MAG TPA: TAXI family TRAP transporter solute-binding subunit [Desulfobacterales bacterium]|nr:TAXI family TRAP transporter solute-binding subunit [Desulfobacterales bacterium]
MEFTKNLLIVAVITAIFFGIGFGGATGVSAEPPKMNFLASSFGTSSYILGVAYEDISKRFYPDLIFNMRETPGLIYNLKKLATLTPEEKKETIITAYDGLTWLAVRGKSPFKKKLTMKIKMLCAPPALTTYFMTKNPDIRTIEDLEGKKVAVGKKTQLGWGQHPKAYLYEGAGLEGKVKLQFVGLKHALSAFKDNLVDAMASGAYVNPITYDLILDPQTDEILSIGQKVYFLSPGNDAAIKRIEAVTGLSHTITIPPGKIKFQERPIIANLGMTYYAGAEELREEAAYHFVKMMITNVDKLRKYHALGKLMTRESLVYGMTKENLHSGAYRAFKEAGLIE